GRATPRGAADPTRRPRHPPTLARRCLPCPHRQRRGGGGQRPGRGGGSAGGGVAAPSIENGGVVARSATPPEQGGDTLGVARRNLLHTVRTPQMLLIGALQPAMLLVLFPYVLGGAVQIPGRSYVDYVVPAVFMEAVLIGGVTTSVGLAQDLKSGIIDRFRSLPMARSAVLAGRTLADVSRSLFSVTIMIGLGLLVGFRVNAALPEMLLGPALISIFAYAFMYAGLALATRDPEGAQVAGILPFFVLMFASNAVVPVETLPGWLQPFARHQPFSETVSAARALFEGGPASTFVWHSLAWS